MDLGPGLGRMVGVEVWVDGVGRWGVSVSSLVVISKITMESGGLVGEVLLVVLLLLLLALLLLLVLVLEELVVLVPAVLVVLLVLVLVEQGLALVLLLLRDREHEGR